MAFNIDISKLKNIKLTKEQQQYVFLGVILIFAGIYGYWKYLMIPLGKQAVELRATLEEKERSLREAKAMKRNWEDYSQRLAAVQRGNQFAARRLPTTDALSGVLLKMNRLFLEGGIEMTKFRPDSSPGIKSDFSGFSKFIADVDVIATYHKFGSFLSKLSEEDIVYNVEDVQIRPGNQADQPGSIAISMRIVVYTEGTS